MGTAQGGYGGGGYGSQTGGAAQPQYGITAAGQQYGLGQAGTYNTPTNMQTTNVWNPGGMGQQPAYGMGTGGQYSPQLRQAQTAWQQQAGLGSTGITKGYGGYDDRPLFQDIMANPAMNQPSAEQQAQWAANPRQPYGMGAQGMGNAYGYGGQQGNPWGPKGDIQGMRMSQGPQGLGGQQGNPWAQLLGMMGGQQQGSTSLSPISQPQAPLQAPPPPPPPPAAPPPTSFSGLNSLPRGAYQIPGYGGGAPSAAPPPQAPAAPSRPNYSPNNPFGGLYSNPQADAWEQQQRGGSPTPAPTPAAPGTDVMRKALAAGDNGYGYGTPGGYQLDTAPSTLDPGSMNALLGIMGGNINGVGYPTSAANYANWYQQTYGTQAPGGPRAYPF